MRRVIGITTISIVLALSGALATAQPTATPADRKRAQIQNRLGWEEMRAEQWDAAAKAFQQAIDIDPTYEYAHYGLGRARLAAKRYDQAIDALSKCRDLYRAQAGRQFSNAQEAQRYRRDRLTEIDEQIRQVRTLNPQSMQAQEQMRQLENVRRDIQIAIDRGTTNLSIQETVPPWVSLSLGSAYFRAGKLADSEREYQATIEADPKSGEAHNNLAVVFFETERYEQAAAALQAAKKVGFRVHPELEKAIKEKRK